MGTEAGEIERLKEKYNWGWFDNESPQHLVTVPAFYMSKYPITQEQWRAILNNNPSYFEGDNLPVEYVSWYDSMDFCKQLSARTGQSYTLPSEAQWEYA